MVMKTLVLYVMNNKELELANKLLNSGLVKAVEIHDKDAAITGYTAELVCTVSENPDLLWIGMTLGDIGYANICYDKLS